MAAPAPTADTATLDRRRGPAGTRFRRWRDLFPAALLVGAGVAVSLAGFHFARQWQHHMAVEMHSAALTSAAEQYVLAVRRELEGALEPLHAAAAFVRAETREGENRFRSFAAALVKSHPVSDGFFWWPPQGGEVYAAIGRPSGSPALRNQPCIARVLSRGGAGPRLCRDVDAERATTVVALRPVAPAGEPPAGFVAQLVRVDRLVEHALQPLERQPVDLWVFDQAGYADNRPLLYRSATRHERPQPPAGSIPSAGVNLAGEYWTVAAAPRPSPSGDEPFLFAWLVLAGGLLLSGLLGRHVYALRRDAVRLAHSNEALSSEVAERRRTEAALRGSEARQRRLLETAPEAVLLLDRDGTVREANVRAGRLFGAGAADLIGAAIDERVPGLTEERRDIDGQPLAALLDDGCEAQELLARRFDGAPVPVEVSIGPGSGDPDGLAIVLLRDISDRKAAEARIQWLARLPEENPNPVMRLDRELQPIYANPASVALAPDSAALPPAIAAAAREALASGRRRELDHHGGGHDFSLVLAPAVDGSFVNVYALDISARKAAERGRERLSAILEGTTDLVGMMDADYNVFFVNASGRRLLGLGDAPVQGTRMADYLTPEAQRTVTDEALPALQRDGSWSGDLLFRCRDGAAIPVSAVLLAHREADGSIGYFSTIARDIRARLQDRERLRRLNRTHAVLSQCNQALVRTDNEYDLVAAFCRNLVAIGGYRFAWVGEALERAGARVVQPILHAGHEAGYLERIRVGWGDDDNGRGPVGSAVRERRTVLTRELTEAQFAPWRQAAAERGYRSVIALPLAEGERTGVLAIYAAEADAFDAEEVQLLEELAEDLAFGIRSLRGRAARREAEALLRLRNRTIELSRNGVMICDARAPDLPLVDVNPAFEAITGYRAAEVLGRNPRFLRGDDAEQPGLEPIRSAVRRGHEDSAVLRNYRKDGSLFWSELFVAPVRDEGGELTHFIGVINDITDAKRYEAELEHRAQYDQVTGLANRNLMQDRLAQALVFAQRYGRKLAVLFLDLDQFKVVNDGLGHSSGDEVVRRIGERIRECVRDGDTVARYGGDEFVVLLTEVEKPEDVTVISRRILARVSEPLTVGEHELHMTISIGAALYPRDGDSTEALLKNADAAMYRSKEQGRNGFHFYTEDLNQRVLERLTLENELRRAIERDELVLHYQPQIDLASGDVVGVEALVRWQHPVQGMISPGRFIPVAEESGLIVPLGEWVLEHACAQNRRWQDAGLAAVTMAVNLSARQFDGGDPEPAIGRALERSGLDPCYLELEVTESAVMRDAVAMADILHRLKVLGVAIAIDDFGTGYSSLAQLKRFPFDRLKIDQSFVRDVTSDPDDAAIAVTVIAMAHSLKLQVIAEGVETEGQLSYLHRHGCDRVQGFFFSRPLPADEVEPLLRRRRLWNTRTFEAEP